jgi:hypothetical protein
MFEELIGDQPPKSPYLWIRISITLNSDCLLQERKQVESDCDVAAEENMDHNC